MMSASVAGTVVFLCAMTCCQDVTRTFPTNYIFLFVFTAFEGVVVGFISAGYTEGSVTLCAGITAIIFLTLTAYAWNTTTDFTGYGPYLFAGLLSLIVFSCVMGILAWA